LTGGDRDDDGGHDVGSERRCGGGGAAPPERPGMVSFGVVRTHAGKSGGPPGLTTWSRSLLFVAGAWLGSIPAVKERDRLAARAVERQL
jgi:hypothetical protein